MRRVFGIMGIVLMIMWSCSKAPLPPESDSNSEHNSMGAGELKVSTIDNRGQKIDSVKIFLNSEFIGYSPLSLKSVSFGSHAIRAQKLGYEIYNKNITVENSYPINEELILKKLPLNTGQLLISVNEDSAKTIVTSSVNEVIDWTDSRELLLTLETGGYFVRCEKSGYALVSKAIEIRVDSITVLNIELQKLADNKLPQLVIVVPDSGRVNEPVIISWESANADNVDIDYIQNPGLNGKREVVLQTSGKHYINATVYNEIEQLSVVDSIVIYEVPNIPPTIKLSVAPNQIYTDEAATLSWHSTNATEVAVDYVPNPGLSGQWQEMFYNSGMVIINAYAYGPGGEAQDSDTLYVEQYNEPPPVVTIDVNPKVVAINETVSINWQSTNANSVDVDFVPQAGLTGQWQTTFSSPGEIIINAYAYNTRERVHAADTIQVVGYVPPSLEFSVDRNEVDFGNPILLSWNTEGYQVIIDHGVGTRGAVGSEEIIFENPGRKEITAVAYGDGNLTTIKKVSVLVNEPAQPQLPVLSLSVVDSVAVGQPALLEWHSWNATAIDVDYVQNPGLNGKTEIIFQSPGQRIITATAYNNSGQVTTSDTIMVVEIPIEPQVESILVPSGAKVCAVHPTGDQVKENAGEAMIEVAGYYRVIAAAWYNSGDDQKNESFFINVIDENGTVINPVNANAGCHKVVPDDSGAPHVTERNAGMFYFSEGVNTIRLSHYYVIADLYSQFIVDGPITDAESIQILYFKLEYVKDNVIEKLAGMKDRI